jgi:hypothetical protein
MTFVQLCNHYKVWLAFALVFTFIVTDAVARL